MVSKAPMPLLMDSLTPSVRVMSKPAGNTEREDFRAVLSDASLESSHVERTEKDATAKASSKDSKPTKKPANEEKDSAAPAASAEAPAKTEGDQNPVGEAPPAGETEGREDTTAAEQGSAETESGTSDQEAGGEQAVGEAGTTGQTSGEAQAGGGGSGSEVAELTVALLKALESSSRVVVTEAPTAQASQGQTLATPSTNQTSATPQTTTPVLMPDTQSQTTSRDGGAMQDGGSMQDGETPGNQNPQISENQPAQAPAVPTAYVDDETGSDSVRPKSDERDTTTAAREMSARKSEQPAEVRALILASRSSESVDRTESEAPRPVRETNVATEFAKLLMKTSTGPSQETTQPNKGEAAQAETPATPASAGTTGSGETASSGETARPPSGMKVTSVQHGAAPASEPGDLNANASKEAIDRIVRVTQATTGQRQSQVRLQLEPPELGQIRIDVKITQGTLSISIQAETAAAKELLESRFEGLRQGLANHGLNVGRFDVELRHSSSANTDSRDPGSDQPGQPETFAHQQSSGDPNAETGGSWRESDAGYEFGDGSESTAPESVAHYASGVDVTA